MRWKACSFAQGYASWVVMLHMCVGAASQPLQSLLRQIDQPCITARAWCSPVCGEELAQAQTSWPFEATFDACDGDWTHGALWRGGELLAQALLALPRFIRNARVLELGTGTGIVTQAAAAAGAAAVVATDAAVDEEALHIDSFHVGSLQTNSFHGMDASRDSARARPTFRRLRWGNWTELARTSPPFDVILAADCVYPSAAAQIVPLLATASRAVTPSGVVVLSYVERCANTTKRLLRELEALACRCGRLRVSRKASIIMLDRWGGGRAACENVEGSIDEWIGA
mmetsp:Transcript_27575/g.60486  ORF Transcript_27575/g.60486 Transcript_27575/m.60486 type:complete len:285 (+) Transcript_27575:427-1281(+)